MAAGRTGLGRVCGRNRKQLTTVQWALIGEHAPSPSPRHAENRTVQARLGSYVSTRTIDGPAGRACHVLDMQVLQHHEAVPFGKVSSLLVQPVLTPTDLPGSQSADLVSDLAFPARHRGSGPASGALPSNLKLQLPQSTYLPIAHQRRHVECLATDNAIVWTIPRSTPTGVWRFVGTAIAGVSMRNEIRHPSESLIMRAPVIRPGASRVIPGKERVQRKRTRPIIGSLTTPQWRFKRVTVSFDACGTSIIRRVLRFLRLGGFVLPE